MKRLLLLFMTVLLVFTSVPYVPVSEVVASAATVQDNMVVSASETKMSIKLSAIGTSGTAQVVKMKAYEYYGGDTLSGLSKSTACTGEVVGTYKCSSSQTITFPRYTSDLEDSIYCKYYVVQNGKILYGPVYTTDIAAATESVYQETLNKKGVFTENNPSYITYFNELGASNATVNLDLTHLLLPNEDQDGKAIDQSKNSDALAYTSNGKTYYFSASYTSQFDYILSTYSKAGANINLIILASKTLDFTKYPYSLVYTANGNAGGLMAYNSSNGDGAGYFTAAMEFLADRYSRSKESGLIKNFIIGNEIDYAYAYYTIQSISNNKGKTSLDVYMEEYSRTLRLANLAVKKFAKDMTVSIPLTHNWAKSGYENKDANNGYVYMYNSYAPKDMLDWLCEKTAARGNYDWCIAPHCYFSILAYSYGSQYDTGVYSGLHNLVTNDYNTSTLITYTNLEILEQYLEQPEKLYNGQVRGVYLTESGISSYFASQPENNNKNHDYERQAAFVAYSYYKCSLLDCVKNYSYYRLVDHTEESSVGAAFGLISEYMDKKPAYEVYKYIDTDKSFEVAEKYLSYISYKKDGVIYSTAKGNVASYKDTMEMVKTSYNWNSMWDESKIVMKKSDDGSDNLSLLLNKYVFNVGDAIKVTATGSGDAWVGIYRADDKVNINEEGGTESIYWYYVNKDYNGSSHKSGTTYDIKSGFFNETRSEYRNLPAGEYKVVLFSDDNYTICDEIKITINSSFSPYVKTNKTEYAYGEDIIVSAAGTADTKTWVGIYKVTDIIPTDVSVYWYYTSNNGEPVVIQNQTYNPTSNNGSQVLKKGDYVLYLFKETDDDSYIQLAKTSISVKEATKPTPFSSVTYELDNETDGFANGVVKVTLPSSGAATDCVLFWGDDNGPLEGYSSLQMFKLTGKVTEYTMPTHTIIPEGATRLLAYSAYGEDNISLAYAEVALPKNSTYKLENNYNSEFQVISDIHVSATQETHNKHFKLFLEDVAKNSKDSSGIFIVGDIADNGYDSQYKLVEEIWKSVDGVPTLHISMGNHDWYNNNPNGQFQNYISYFNAKANNNGKVYYDEVVDGNYYIYLGSEQRGNGLYAYLSDAQLSWLKEKLEAYSQKEPNKPIFLLLHQSFYNTIAGSLPGEGWNGINNEEALASILKNYKNVIMFSGHSHWVLDSKSNMFAGSNNRPTAFNTSSVAYLWNGYNVVSGEEQEGSEGYFVRVYDDKVVVMGRDFVNGVYNPSAIYVVERNEVVCEKDTYTVSNASDIFNLKASALYGKTRVTYVSTNEDVAVVDSLGNVRVKNEGTAKIIVTAAATDTKTVGSKVITVNVEDTKQEIIANSFVKSYGDADFNIGAKFRGNPKITYTSSNPNVATVNSNGLVSIKGVGYTEIKIEAAATDIYVAAEKTISVTVTKAQQNISVSSKIQKKAGDADFSLGAKLTVGDGKLSYSSSDENVVKVSTKGIVTVVGSGSAQITVTASATAHFAKATKKVTVVVDKLSQKISASSQTKLADVGSFELGAKLTTGNGTLSYVSSDTSVATVSSTGVVKVKKSGITNITITASETAKYAKATLTVKLTVNKAQQVISAEDITKNVNASSFNLGAKLTKGDGKLSYKSSNKKVVTVSSNGKVTIKGAGTAKITVTAGATDKYNSATKTVTVKITKKSLQTIKVSSVTKTYGSKAFNLGATLKKGNGKLSYKSSNKNVVTVSSSGKVTIKGVGYAYITVTASATSKYEKTTKKVLIKINPQPVTIKSLKKASSKSIKLTWKADKKVSGYEIEYSTNKNFTKKTTTKIKISKNSTTAKTIKGLKNGKTYYVRIRSYKSGDVTVYSSYKSVSIKLK